mmetsp:Transcript_122864/g.358589  ORF Transcript_122864/g.358589 Transcript_122864/m.358589 type:complete len:207 (+) Transcript_122864:1614-2234(+)
MCFRGFPSAPMEWPTSQGLSRVSTAVYCSQWIKMLPSPARRMLNRTPNWSEMNWPKKLSSSLSRTLTRTSSLPQMSVPALFWQVTNTSGFERSSSSCASWREPKAGPSCDWPGPPVSAFSSRSTSFDPRPASALLFPAKVWRGLVPRWGAACPASRSSPEGALPGKAVCRGRVPRAGAAASAPGRPRVLPLVVIRVARPALPGLGL